ncbi:MAG TPA: hypothetical protein VMQ58_02750 [Candidatus Saccharimonadales bacterium]|jgi:dTMP kinase|nr:hypothetical protein [Candidatus Saccharimonadales bacterium]
MNRGKLIVLEGPEGSGKTTQANILLKRLQSAQLTTKLFSYPDISSSLIVRSFNRMLNNPDYDISEISKVLLDAVMSSETMKIIKKSLSDGVYCICESSYISTIINYCFLNNIDRYDEIVSLMAFANMDIIPDLTIIFDAPPNVLIERRHGNGRNLNIDETEKVRTGYLLEAKTHKYPIIFSTDSIESISDLVWGQVAKCLESRAVDSRNTIESLPKSLAEILGSRSSHSLSEPKLYDSLSSEIIIIESENVYGFQDNQRLDSFLKLITKNNSFDNQNLNLKTDTKLSNSEISLLGADKLRSIYNHNLIINDISNFLIKKIETSQLVNCLDGNFSFKLKDSSGKSNYIIPEKLDTETKKTYINIMDQIYNNYFEIIKQLFNYLTKTNKTKLNFEKKIELKSLAESIAKNVLPVASKSSIFISGSRESLDKLIYKLQTEVFKESKSTAKNLKEVAIRLTSDQFASSRSDMANKNLSNQIKSKQIINKLIKTKLRSGFSTNLETVSLVEYYPKNELDLVSYMLFENSNLSLQEIKNEISRWSYEDKIIAFKAYADKQDPGQVFELARYSWDILGNYDDVIGLIGHNVIENLSLQDLTPRYGYNIPKIIEDAEMTDQYQECFDLSLKLYSQMMLKNYVHQAQYATLIGHKLRIEITFNARNAFIILKSSDNNQTAKLMLEKINENHPMITNLINSKI